MSVGGAPVTTDVVAMAGVSVMVVLIPVWRWRVPF